ncbi:MAG: hypothetical protein HKP22_03385 [Gammaproteobacteria bacterium]|nr:hypothetical protein [Gammaproteobacteria bacterium]
MRTPLFKYFLITAIFYASSISAGLYKGLDEEGNVIYSDKPFENSEQFTPPAITVVDPLKVPPKEEVVKEEKAAETKYTKFSISAPVNDQTIWNEPDLMVSLKLTPALSTEEGHTTWLLMDGKPIVKNSQSLLLQIGRSDRGQHTLQAQIRNKKGKIIKRTKPVTIHIKNTVVRRQAR